MNPIYKINHLVDGEIKSIYVFYGKKIKEPLETIFHEFFSEKEIQNIQQKNIDVKIIEQQIHFDDSIGIIKLKILNEFKNICSLEQIYLFCEKIETINPIALYQILTQNKRINLTKIRFDQALSNIVSDEKGELLQIPSEKSVYDYDDIASLKLENKQLIVDKVLGQKFFIVENEYPFVVNPYKVKNYDTFFEKTARKSLTTLNSHLLLNTGEIINNNIYVCFAKDVLTYLDRKNVNEETTIKIYYPFLYSKNIFTLEQLKENELVLIESNKKLLSEKVFDNFKTIDMFYDVYKQKKTDLKYINKGIKSIRATLKPKYNIFIPLDIIFKILHATEKNPLIKYNPSIRQENIYRLYADKNSMDGRKIPYLKKGTIFKLIKNIGKTKSVTVYVDNKEMEEIIQMFCEFNENGFITFFAEFKTVFDETKIDDILKQFINPIIQQIQSFLEQSGYKIQLFEGLKNENVDIEQLTYETNIQISKKINLETFHGCLSSIFNNESNKFKKNIQLRFKRVSNFNKVTSQEAFILEKRDDGYTASEILDALVENFQGDITRKEAEDLVKKLVNEVQIERGVRKSDIRIKNNPGFKTTLEIDQQSGSVKIMMENINDIYYLSTIPIYLDTMIRLTQDKKSTNYPLKEINVLCSTAEKEDIEIPDIISPNESQVSEFEVPILDDDDESVSYKKPKSSDEVSEDHGEEEKNAFNLFFGNDEDEEEEDEEVSSFEGGQLNDISKSSSSSSNTTLNQTSIPEIDNTQENETEEENFDEEPENTIKNIDGMSLRNYFQNEIEKKDKALIIKQNVGKFSAYSKVCQSATNRQPVIITDQQLANINKEHKGFLREEDIIRYGSDKKKQYNYICPRYWCLKTNTVIEPNEMKEIKENGKTVLVHPTCGKILDENADVIKPGHYVYEFYKPPKNNPDYKRFPNFQVDKHPDGYCLPCCFDKWKTDSRIKAKNKCYGLEEEKNKEKEEENDEYVKGPDKFPLSPGRWGYLPPAIQQILREINADCQVSKTNTNLKSNHPCLLRHGVEVNEKQSFIACISDAIFFAKTTADPTKFAKVLSIKEMRKRIIESLTIDEFIKYQNGNLVIDFYDKNRKINGDKYKSSKIFSKLDFAKETEQLFYQKVVSAFENFISFLEDDDVVINHTYLWDIICRPNKYLFPLGLNLIILEIPNNDITNNVQIICPTNHYTAEFYDPRKSSLFLMKEDNYYEPIYSLTIVENKKSIKKIFNEYSPNLPINIKLLFKEVIKPLYKTICKPLKSMPNIYTAKNPILFYHLIEKLDEYNYEILKQVVNFKNKVIGVVAKSPTNKIGFIPCYPSAMDENLKENLDFVFMTDDNIWKTYQETFRFLMELEKKKKGKTNTKDVIPCKPIFKIVEDELVVGILTETNQFIQISNPIPEDEISHEYNLPSFKNTNYIVQPKSIPMLQSDTFITTMNDHDKERVDYIQKIKLETQFYNIFRNTIRILLNDYENSKTKETIENELKKEYIIYNEKIKIMNHLLKQLAKNKIRFIGDDNYYKLIKNISTCIVKDKESCDKTSHLCVFSSEGKCNIILPEKNLITKKMNEPFYYNKMADEFIRYNYIRNFMFQPQTYLSFNNIGYNLRDDEIILLQSLLTQEYFETLVPATMNSYVKYNTYDQAEPQISQTYDNVIKNMESNENNIENIKECIKITSKITSQIWSACFPKNFTEIKYEENVVCTFQIMIDLIEKKTNEKYSINKIKNDLIEEYKKYIEIYKTKIIDILIIEGKKTLGDQVKANSLSFTNFIYDEQYFLTPFDLWLLLQKYKIPSFFISQQNLFQTNYEKHIFNTYSNDLNDLFVFIVIPGLKAQKIPGYKIIQNTEKDVFITINHLNATTCEEMVQNSFRNKISIEQFLEKFVKSSSKYAKKKPKIILQEDDDTKNDSFHSIGTKKNKVKKNTTRKYKKKLNIES